MVEKREGERRWKRDVKARGRRRERGAGGSPAFFI